MWSVRSIGYEVTLEVLVTHLKVWKVSSGVLQKNYAEIFGYFLENVRGDVIFSKFAAYTV